jgi:aryl carrier-like protein
VSAPNPNRAGDTSRDVGVFTDDEDPGGVRATLTELWQKLFAEFGPGNSLVALGPDTDLFAAGGSSIIAVMMLSGVYEEFGVNVSFGALMEKPTIRALSQHVIRLMLDE